MDRLTTIEQALASTMFEIDGSTLASGYTYYNDVTVVNIDDEALAVNKADFPAISIYMDEDGEENIEGTQDSYENSVGFRIVCGIENELSDITSDVSPRRAINIKMNELLSDIKARLSVDNQLNYTAELVQYIRSEREYSEDGNALRAGDLVVYVEITYEQSRSNPNNNCS